MPEPHVALQVDHGPQETLEQSGCSVSPSSLHTQPTQDDGNHAPMASALQNGPAQP
jgi:hypothetical protein